MPCCAAGEVAAAAGLAAAPLGPPAAQVRAHQPPVCCWCERQTTETLFRKTHTTLCFDEADRTIALPCAALLMRSIHSTLACCQWQGRLMSRVLYASAGRAVCSPHAAATGGAGTAPAAAARQPRVAVRAGGALALCRFCMPLRAAWQRQGQRPWQNLLRPHHVACTAGTMQQLETHGSTVWHAIASLDSAGAKASSWAGMPVPGIYTRCLVTSPCNHSCTWWCCRLCRWQVSRQLRSRRVSCHMPLRMPLCRCRRGCTAIRGRMQTPRTPARWSCQARDSQTRRRRDRSWTRSWRPGSCRSSSSSS